jgi:tetratricopeptide (TPR) repeat protein
MLALRRVVTCVGGATVAVLLAGSRAAHPAEPSPAQREGMAALLAHSDRDWAARAVAEGDHMHVTCGPGPAVQDAARLVEPLERREETRAFAHRWYRATAVRAQAWGCLDEARHWVRRGLQAVPDDPDLLLAAGALDEVAGSLAGAGAGERRAALGRARSSFESALRRAPALHEARLRLGRVEWRLGRPRPARAALEAVLAEAKDERLLFLAHLFLGRVEEDAGHVAPATRAYRAALGRHPSAQSAAVALSHARLLAGEAADAREVMEDALAYAGDRHRTDPLWTYALGRAEDAELLFDALRAEAGR